MLFSVVQGWTDDGEGLKALIAASGPGSELRAFPVLRFWEVTAQEGMGGRGWGGRAALGLSGLHKPAQLVGDRAGVGTQVCLTLKPHFQLPQSVPTLQLCWFPVVPLRSYFLLPFLSAITCGDCERELTCHSERDLRLVQSFRCEQEAFRRRGDTKARSCLSGPRPQGPGSAVLGPCCFLVVG